MIFADKKDLEIIKSIIFKHLPTVTVRAFGSRVNGSPKPHSDLDLVLTAESKISTLTLAKIEEDLENSSLPYRVDILDWHSLSEDFKKIIEENCERIS